MKKMVVYIIAITLIMAFGMLFDYLENGTNYALLFKKSTSHRTPATASPSPNEAKAANK